MVTLEMLPEKSIDNLGPMAAAFLSRGIDGFRSACEYVYRLPYGYNSDRDDPMILFKEGKGTCTTKHAVIATLAGELRLPVTKSIGIYAMTEPLVTGTQSILDTHGLPYVPMVHCFLVHGGHRLDLTAGNLNGKNGPIESFLHTEAVTPHISAREEYLRFRTALARLVESRGELRGIPIKTFLKAREEGLALLKANTTKQQETGHTSAA
jgi:hypothetical protein